MNAVSTSALRTIEKCSIETNGFNMSDESPDGL